MAVLHKLIIKLFGSRSDDGWKSTSLQATTKRSAVVHTDCFAVARNDDGADTRNNEDATAYGDSGTSPEETISSNVEILYQDMAYRRTQQFMA